MMCETSITLIPFDDPSKKILEEIIEYGYDRSEVTKVKGITVIIYTSYISYADRWGIVYCKH